MGILFDQQGTLGPGSTKTIVVRAIWDGVGSTKYTISAIAQGICGTGEKVFRDLSGFSRNNDPIAKTIWHEEGKPFLEEWEKKVTKKLMEGMMEWFADDESADGDIKHPNHGYESQEHYKGLNMAKGLSGDKYLKWEIDLDPEKHPNGLLLSTDMYNEYQWAECRGNLSTMKPFERENKQYKKAIGGMKKHLEKLESLLAKYDRAIKRWCDEDSDGSVYLIGLAQLNLVERMLDIYTEQDSTVEDVAGVARELTGYAADEYQQRLKTITSDVVKSLVDYYYDPEVNKALNKYLSIWDPTHAYYFHKNAAKAEGMPDFDERLFAALGKLGQYLSSDEGTATRVGEEANYSFERLPFIKEKMVESEDTEFGPQGEQAHEKAKQVLFEKIFKNLHESTQTKTGILTTLATWSTVVGKLVGNIEGPPSVMSLLLTQFSKTDAFINVLRHDTLARAFVTIGLPLKLVGNMAEIIKKSGTITRNLEVVKKAYQEMSWRSPAIIHVFTFLGVATLMYDVGLLIDEYERGERSDDPSDEITRLVLKITEDLANISLTWITLKISRDMRTALMENINARASYMYYSTLKGAPPWRVPVVKTLHGTVALIGVVLSTWELAEDWHKTDFWQKSFTALTACAGMACAIGAIFSLSWLGPAGFVAGVLMGVTHSIYNALQPGIKNTLLALLEGFKKSKFFKLLEERVVKEENSWVIFTSQYTFGEVFNELTGCIADYDWEKELEKEHVVRYKRSGLSLKMLEMLYEKDKEEMLELLNRQRYEEKLRKKHNQDFKVALVSPKMDAKLIIGAPSIFRVTVSNHPTIPFVWLELPYEDLEGYFSTEGTNMPEGIVNSYDKKKGVIMLYSRRSTKNTQNFAGHVFLTKVPPRSVAEFLLYVPKREGNRLVYWSGNKPPKAHYKRALNFRVGIHGVSEQEVK